MTTAELNRPALGSRQMTTFRLAGHLFGVEVEAVQEVIRYQEMRRVPLAPPTVGGLINLRGQVITAVDLRARLALPDRDDGDLPMNVVVRTTEAAVSLLVDAIGAVIDADEALFEPPPDTLLGPARELIRGAYKLENELLLALDVAKAIQV